MTRKEMMKYLKKIRDEVTVCSLESTFDDDCKSIAMNMAIELLEQEPCVDCISRKQAFEIIKDHSYPVRYDTNSTEYGMTLTGIEQALNELSSVTPTRSVGRWITVDDTHDRCSNCGAKVEIVMPEEYDANFCPNCGCQMQEVNNGEA